MKRIFMSLLAIGFLSTTLLAQNNPAMNVEQQANAKVKSAMLVNNPVKDQFYSFDIIGTSGTVFTTSNFTDGTTNSYINTQQIIVTLIPADKTKGTFQVIFFTHSDEVLKTASYENNVVKVFYPIALYDDIKGKLEASFAAKKKVVVNVTEKTNGYREGVLSF